jgi:hypothetical protein
MSVISSIIGTCLKTAGNFRGASVFLRDPEKMQNPGKFSVGFSFGDLVFALCDLSF